MSGDITNDFRQLTELIVICARGIIQCIEIYVKQQCLIEALAHPHEKKHIHSV